MVSVIVTITGHSWPPVKHIFFEAAVIKPFYTGDPATPVIVRLADLDMWIISSQFICGSMSVCCGACCSRLSWNKQHGDMLFINAACLTQLLINYTLGMM